MDFFRQQFGVGLVFLVFFSVFVDCDKPTRNQRSPQLDIPAAGLRRLRVCYRTKTGLGGGKKTFLDTEPTNSVFSKLVFQLKGLLVSLREILGPL